MSSIPILVFSAALDGDSQLKGWAFADHLRKDTCRRDVLTPPIKSLIKSWRRAVLDDLDVLGIGIDVSPRTVKVGYTVKVKVQDTKVLSLRYVLSQGRLPYSWLSKDFFQIEKSIEELEYLIKDYLSKTKNELQRSDWERQFQLFFNRNPNFLFGDSFEKFWSEPVLRDRFRKRKFKPDFVVQPSIFPELGKNWDIIDLKTPLEEFLSNSDFHKTFTARFTKHIKQVRDYYNYFNDDHNKGELESVFKFQPKNPRCTLIISRRDVFHQKQDVISQNLNENNASFIDLITYDEVLERQKMKLQQLLETRVL